MPAVYSPSIWRLGIPPQYNNVLSAVPGAKCRTTNHRRVWSDGVITDERTRVGFPWARADAIDALASVGRRCSCCRPNVDPWLVVCRSRGVLGSKRMSLVVDGSGRVVAIAWSTVDQRRDLGRLATRTTTPATRTPKPRASWAGGVIQPKCNAGLTWHTTAHHRPSP